MKYLKIAFIFGLALMISAGCSKEEIQPDPSNATEDAVLKGAKVKKGPDHYVPFKGTFDVYTKAAPQQLDGYKYYQTGANGQATHLGRTKVDLEQKWWPIMGNPFENPEFADKVVPGIPMPPFEIPEVDPFISYYPDADEIQWWGMGTGEITFTAANGDVLLAEYVAFSYHPNMDIAVIYTMGWFVNGEDGRFAEAEGDFLWTGVFNKTGPNAGTGVATAVGKIKY